MRFHSLCAFILTAGLLTGCDDDPTAPRADSNHLGGPPRPAVVSDPSEGSAPLLPLPGATDVTLSGASGGWYVGSSGGRAALWTYGDPSHPTELAPFDEATHVDFYGNTVQFVGSMDGRAAAQREDSWQRYPIVDLGTLPAHDRSIATATDLGFQSNLVVGDSWTSGREAESRAFLWDGTTMTELPPLPGHVGSRALSVGGVHGGTVSGLSYPAGGGSAEIVVWIDGVPASTGYDYDAYLPHGLYTYHPGAAEMLISARAGNEVVEWRDGVVTVVAHPHADDPTGSYQVVGVSNHRSILYWLEVNEPLVTHRFGGRGDSGDFQSLSPLPLDHCIIDLVCTSPMRQYPMLVTDAARPQAAVKDLTVTWNGTTSIALSWTQVDDGTGSPAHYRVKYSEPPLGTRDGNLWSDARVGCDVTGNAIGALASCTVAGLDANTPYDFTLMSYRLENGAWADATYSNMAVGQTGWNLGGGPPPPPPPHPVPGAVSDLSATGATTSTVTLTWTQVDDGTGNPAWYRVKYAVPSISWKTATIGCDRQIEGDEIGAGITCTVEGLTAGTRYDFQLMSYRMVDGVWHDARYSNITTDETH